MYDSRIENIRKSVNIVDIISSYNISITKKIDGKYECFCPFHKNKFDGQCMIISEDTQTYKCYKCGAEGNVFIFVRDYEDTTFMNAVKTVVKRQKMIEQAKAKNKK